VLLSAVLTGCGSNDQHEESSTAAKPFCEPADISRDLGHTYSVMRCHGDWAFIDIGGLGDTHSLARLVNGRWTSYTAFPTSICQSRARSDGVPEQELSSFRPC
jgi:hypothetical protein